MLPITTTRIYKMVRVTIDLFTFFFFSFLFFFKYQILKLPNEFLLDKEWKKKHFTL